MKKFLLGKRNKVLLLLAFLCLSVSVLCLCRFYALNAQDKDQSAARRWQSGKQNFAQLSVFFSPEENWSKQDRRTLLSRLRMQFQENSITNESEQGGEDELIKDCYSCEASMTLTSGNKTAQANVTATGGDFFYFHQFQWLSGYAYSDEDVMQDRIVLDKELAWSLFGSANVEGMSLTMEDKTYYVAGVVDLDNDRASKATYGEKNRAWISYSVIADGQKETVPITAYEIVMPNPVDGWAKGQLSDILTPEEGELVLVENSSRADFFQVFENIKTFSEQMVVEKAVKYPYWENAARIRDCKREIYLFFATLCLIYPLGLAVAGIISCYRTIGRKLKKRKQAGRNHYSEDNKIIP